MIARLNRWWQDRSLRTKSLTVAAIPVLALGIAAAAFGSSQQTEKDASDLVAHTIEVQASIEDLGGNLGAVETSVRGYTITGRPEWLGPYDRSVADMEGEVGQLQSLVADNPSQEARAQTLQTAIDRSLAVFARLRAAGQITGPVGADTQSQMAESKAATDDVQAQLATMTAEETRLLAQRQATLDADRNRSTFVVIVALTGAVLGGGLAALLLGSGVVSRIRRLEENARRLAERLASR